MNRRAALLLLIASAAIGCPSRVRTADRPSGPKPEGASAVSPVQHGQGFLGAGGGGEIPGNVERLRDDPSRGNVRGEAPE